MVRKSKEKEILVKLWTDNEHQHILNDYNYHLFSHDIKKINREEPNDSRWVYKFRNE
jgi:hypothetical protein